MNTKHIPKFYGVKKSGVIEYAHPDELERHLAVFEEGQEIEATFRKKRKPRTQGDIGEATNQNGYFWLLIRWIGDEIGELDQDDVCEWALKAVGHVKVMPDGEKVAASTRDMEAGPFQELCKRVQTWAAIPGNVCEKGLYLPDPHETDYQV